MPYMRDATGQRLDAMHVFDGLAQPQRARGPLAAKLEEGRRGATLQVLGDSTGAGLARWPYLLAGLLGQKYPTHNVDYLSWNGTSLGYDALGSGLSSRVQTGSAPSPATVVDNTTRADNASSPGSTSDANAFPWLVRVGTVGISSNRIAHLSANSALSLSTQYADSTGSIQVAATSSLSPRFYLRYQDSLNTFFAQINISGTSGANFLLYKVIAGLSTLITTATLSLALSTLHTVSWSIIGRALSVSINGGNTLSYTITDADVIAQPVLVNETTLAMLGHTGVTWTNLAVTNVAPTLTVRSASTSGQVCSYSQTNFAAQVPSPVDVCIINYGHNEGGTDARAPYLRLVDQLLSTFPKTVVMATLQNPRAHFDNNFANGLARTVSIEHLAINEGWGVVNVRDRFLADTNYAADLLNGDGLHPSDAVGSPAWANEVMRALDPTSIVQQRGMSGRPSSIFLEASRMVSAEGTPTLTAANGWPAWDMVHGAGNQGVQAFMDVPASWGAVDFYLLWMTAVATGLTGSTNQVRLEVLLGYPGGLTGLPANNSAGTALASAGLGSGFVNNNSIAYTQQATLAASAVSPTGRPLLVRARRVGGDVNDTLTQDIYLLGVLAKRAG